MATPAQPILIRDVSKGRLSRAIIGNGLIPPNSVSETINVNYDQIIGQGVVRPGTTRFGNVVAANRQALGLAEFVNQGGVSKRLLAVFSGASNATIYVNAGVWNASNITNLDNAAKVRFAVLGGFAFAVNGVDPMRSSSDGATWGTTNCITGVTPFLVTRAKSRLLVAATTPTRDRVYFSSIIDPSVSPFITWDTDPVTGDWIDINPDDGQTLTAFLDVANQVILFKTSTMYRLNVITKTVDTDNITNVGAVSQEAVTLCQGLGYFYSGEAIYVTDGGAPQQISRAGVQDLLDQIPQAYKSKVSLGSDENNVTVSIGAVTISGVLYNNVQLKFSTRDQSWSVHSYAKRVEFFSQYTLPDRLALMGATTVGDVIEMDQGTTDDGEPIFYQMDTQELDCGNRAHVKSISDEMVVYSNNGEASEMYASCDGKGFKAIKGKLNDRVNILDEVSLEFRFLVFRWMGSSKGPAPVFEGIQVEKIIDQGVQGKQTTP